MTCPDCGTPHPKGFVDIGRCGDCKIEKLLKPHRRRLPSEWSAILLLSISLFAVVVSIIVLGQFV